MNKRSFEDPQWFDFSLRRIAFVLAAALAVLYVPWFVELRTQERMQAEWQRSREQFIRYFPNLPEMTRQNLRHEVMASDPDLAKKAATCERRAKECDGQPRFDQLSAQSSVCAAIGAECSDLAALVLDRMHHRWVDSAFERYFAKLTVEKQRRMKQEAQSRYPRLQALSHQCFAFKKLCEELETETLATLKRDYVVRSQQSFDPE